MPFLEYTFVNLNSLKLILYRYLIFQLECESNSYVNGKWKPDSAEDQCDQLTLVKAGWPDPLNPRSCSLLGHEGAAMYKCMMDKVDRMYLAQMSELAGFLKSKGANYC